MIDYEIRAWINNKSQKNFPAIFLLKKTFLLLFPIWIIVIPLILLPGLIEIYSNGGFNVVPQKPSMTWDGLLWTFLPNNITRFLNYCFNTFVYLMILNLSWQRLTNSPFSASNAIKKTLNKYWIGLVAQTSIFLISILGIAFLIVPGIILWAGLFLTIPIILIENQGIRLAIKKSWQMMDGYKLNIFVLHFKIGFFLCLIFLILLSPLQFLFSESPFVNYVKNFYTLIINLIFGLVLGPITMIIYEKLNPNSENNNCTASLDPS